MKAIRLEKTGRALGVTKGAGPKRAPRHLWVLLHRYAGLYLVFWLTVAGLTGSLLAFYNELDVWINPHLYTVSHQDAPLLDALVLRQKAQEIAPQANFHYLSFQEIRHGRTAPMYAEPKGGEVLGFETLYLNPYTGREAARQAALTYWPLTGENIMPFIYALHYKLALPGQWGIWLFGIAALIWMIDCFVGAYLSLPLRRHGAAVGTFPQRAKQWWMRFKPAWLVRWHAGAYKINFDLHRAGGLWVWAVLFVFALSSVAFNLGEQVYRPVMKAVFGLRDVQTEIPQLKQPLHAASLSFTQARKVGQEYMAAQAATHGFVVQRESALSLDTQRGVYEYSVFSDRDINARYGGTSVYFDANTGDFKALSLPSGQNGASTFTNWIMTLHMGKIWGLPMQLFVCLMGLVVAMLSVTGVVIWQKKRASRLLQAEPTYAGRNIYGRL